MVCFLNILISSLNSQLLSFISLDQLKITIQYRIFLFAHLRQSYRLCTNLSIEADPDFYCLVKSSCNVLFNHVILTLSLEITCRRATHLPFKCSASHWQWWATAAFPSLWHFSQSTSLISNSEVKSTLSPKDGYQVQVKYNMVGKWTIATKDCINWNNSNGKKNYKLMLEEKSNLKIKSDFQATDIRTWFTVLYRDISYDTWTLKTSKVVERR